MHPAPAVRDFASAFMSIRVFLSTEYKNNQLKFSDPAFQATSKGNWILATNALANVSPNSQAIHVTQKRSIVKLGYYEINATILGKCFLPVARTTFMNNMLSIWNLNNKLLIIPMVQSSIIFAYSVPLAATFDWFLYLLNSFDFSLISDKQSKIMWVLSRLDY